MEEWNEIKRDNVKGSGLCDVRKKFPKQKTRGVVDLDIDLVFINNLLLI